MKIRSGDKVKILSGKDKGKTGKVLQVFIAKAKVSVEGINLMYKNMRPRKQGEKGQRIQFPAPIAISNIAVLCPKCHKFTKIGYKIISKNKKMRVCKRCQETFS